MPKEIIITNENGHQMSNEQMAMDKHSTILSLTLIIYIWIALILIRYHPSYFNQSNFIPLLLICIVRTIVELSWIMPIYCTANNNNNNENEPTEWTGWWWWLGFDCLKWCQIKIFLVLFQLQVICSLFAVLLFPNVIFCLLANKIYLTKNYINSLQAIKRCQQIQIILAILFPLLHLLLIYCVSSQYHANCWPQFNHLALAIFVTAPVLQITVVFTAGIIYLHCSRRIFSEYDYPTNMQYIHSDVEDTSAMEKHIKEIFFSRCKHCSIWFMATLIYLICIVGCLCFALLYNHTSYAWIGLDIAISLTFLLFARIKYLFNLFVKCLAGKGVSGVGVGVHDIGINHRHNRSAKKSKNNQQQQHHCYVAAQIMINGSGGGGQESASSSMDSKQTRDNSISILSDTSKTFLTLAHGGNNGHNGGGGGGGQISSTSLMPSPKIYPAHQSSCIYGNGTAQQMNQSSHLYESPSHLYNYEYEQRRYVTGQPNQANLSSSISSSSHTMFNSGGAGRHHHRTPLLFYAAGGVGGGSSDSSIRTPQGPPPPPPPLPLPPLIPLPSSNSIHRQHSSSTVIRDSNMSLNRIRPNIASSHLAQHLGPSRAYSFDQYS